MQEQKHLKDSRVGEASGHDPSLAQQALYQQANVQGKCLVVADQQQGSVQGDGPTALLHPALSPSGEEHGTLQALQGAGEPACPKVSQKHV